MLQQILDLHIHSKYSRACSKALILPTIAQTCAIRGIDIVATGDFTHPKWFEHMKEELIEATQGIYTLNSKRYSLFPPTKFIIGTEIASIKKHVGKVRRVHLLLFAPSLGIVDKFNRALRDRGCNLAADGRPIVGLTAHDLLELALETDERMVMIPAHAWTPWFGVFGSRGGYDSLEECFADLAPHVFAIETGLSSDPLMNWRWSKLDHISLVSNSDAHSPAKLGREANVMQFRDDKDITYDEIMRILRAGDRNKFLFTIEFYPEEGKYHLDGHRVCQFVCTPAETKKNKGICPKCQKPLVIGVMNRVNELADRNEEAARVMEQQKIPYKNLVPLTEILADAMGVGVGTKTVQAIYETLVHALGSEFNVLLHQPLAAIEHVSGKHVALAIDRVRQGNIFIEPGYDGEFGVVKVFRDGETRGQPMQGALALG